MHQRSLEVYEEVFRIIGIEGLKRDLHLWSSGLFPFFQYAATASRPAVLALYDRYYLPLERDGLRPVTKALALAILPGLEEETGDFFEDVAKLLDRLAVAVDPSFLNQALFLAQMTNPSARVSIINYLSGRLSTALLACKASISEPSSSPCLTRVIGPDGGLFIRGMAAALEDDNVLVRRGIFDLLVAVMPLGEFVAFADFSPQDRQMLVGSAVSVVLRKDLSLARRLYTWLLGDSDDSSAQRAYFVKHGLDLVAESLTAEMTQTTTLGSTPGAPSSRPFKVFIALLDKWEIGHPLSERIAYDAFVVLYRAHEHANPADVENIEVLTRSLFDAVEPHILWSSIYRAGRGKRDQGLAVWLLSVCSSPDAEAMNVHLPLLLRASVLRYIDEDETDLSLASVIVELSGGRPSKAGSSTEAIAPSQEDIVAYYSTLDETARSEWRQRHLNLSVWDSALLSDSIRALQRARNTKDAEATLTLLRTCSFILKGRASVGDSIAWPRDDCIVTLQGIIGGGGIDEFEVLERSVDVALAATQASVDPPFVLAGHALEFETLQAVRMHRKTSAWLR